MFVLAIVTTVAFCACGARNGERRKPSSNWAALMYFNGQVLPGWAWAAYTQRWQLFAVGTVLLAGLTTFTLHAANAANSLKQKPIDVEAKP
jgi:hypothetical protein